MVKNFPSDLQGVNRPLVLAYMQAILIALEFTLAYVIVFKIQFSFLLIGQCFASKPDKTSKIDVFTSVKLELPMNMTLVIFDFKTYSAVIAIPETSFSLEMLSLGLFLKFSGYLKYGKFRNGNSRPINLPLSYGGKLK